MKHALAILVGLLVVFVLALILTSCGPMLNGGGGPAPKPSHMLLVLHNTDPGYHPGDPLPVGIACWTASSITSASSFDVPALGDKTVDLGTVKPDGFQLVTTAWNGIVGGPGGLVFQSPEYQDGWIFDVTYPSGVASVRR